MLSVDKTHRVNSRPSQASDPPTSSACFSFFSETTNIISDAVRRKLKEKINIVLHKTTKRFNISKNILKWQLVESFYSSPTVQTSI